MNGDECRAKSEAAKAEDRRIKMIQKQKEKEAKEQARIQVRLSLACPRSLSRDVYLALSVCKVESSERVM